MPSSEVPLPSLPQEVAASSAPLRRPYPGCFLNPPPRPTPSAFFATIEVTTERTVHPTNVRIATRWLLDTLHICVCGQGAPFVSIGDIPTRFVLDKGAEIAINQDTLQMTVLFRTSPPSRPPTSTETEHLCNILRRESIILEPGARVYKRGNVTIDYLDNTSFLLRRAYRRMFPLGLCQYLEDWYIFTLGPQSFSLAPFSEDALTPVPLLLFPSRVG